MCIHGGQCQHRQYISCLTWQLLLEQHQRSIVGTSGLIVGSEIYWSGNYRLQM
jgi:hypothetical protein